MRSFTIEELKDLQLIAAKVVMQFGDIYLPLFERMTKEVEKAESNQSVKLLGVTLVNNSRNNATGSVISMKKRK